MEQFKTMGAVIDFAIAREIEAVELYQKLADKETDGAKQDILLGFVAEELGHKRRLEAVKAKSHVESIIKSRPNLKYNDHYVDVSPTPHMSYKESLTFAMQCEKSAMRLYLDFAQSSSLEPIKELFNALAKEEEKHLHRFELLYQQAPRETW